MNKVLLFCVIVLVFAVGAHALSCPETCEPCTPVEQLECKGGTVSDMCGCCDVCAKIAGESCGGPDDLMGRCDVGLRCDIAEPDDINSHGECVEVEDVGLPPLQF